MDGYTSKNKIRLNICPDCFQTYCVDATDNESKCPTCREINPYGISENSPREQSKKRIRNYLRPIEDRALSFRRTIVADSKSLI